MCYYTSIISVKVIIDTSQGLLMQIEKINLKTYSWRSTSSQKFIQKTIFTFATNELKTFSGIKINNKTTY